MTDPTVSALLMMLGFQAKHFLGDFMFQTQAMLEAKHHYGRPLGAAHAAIHGVLSLPVIGGLTGAWGLALGVAVVEALLHYHIDWAKARIEVRLRLEIMKPGYWFAFGLDQFLHQLTYIAIVLSVLPWLGA